MRIANPIYDVVFKYLLSDNKIAKLLIAAIIGEDIIELDLKSTEHQSDIASRNLLVYRLDFAAKIRNADGTEKLILIEIQKAKLASDIMRFRRYLGSQYASDNNVIAESVDKYNALPIITIYFLGHKLEHTKVPIIKVQREYKDIASGEVIKEKETFIECLTHDSFIIQIPFLSKNRKTELEALLSIFDQSMTESSRHFLELNENDYPEKYHEVIRRLVKAAAEPAVREVMTVEDEILNDFNALERTIQKKDEAIAEKDEAIAEKDEQLIEKDEAIEHAITLLADKLNITREAAELMINDGRN